MKKIIFPFVLLVTALFSNVFAAGLEVLPGRLGTDGIYWAEIGGCKMYFYMTPERHEAAMQLISLVNEELHMSFDQSDLPCPTRELIALALKNPEEDPRGVERLDQYADIVKESLENHFGFRIAGSSRYINLNLNWEALILHRDIFTQQYDYLRKNKLPANKYTFIQDLALIDWEMQAGTVSATLVQDGARGDRYLITLFPGEVVGTLYTEQALNLKADETPGNITMPYHATVASMDMSGSLTPGSSKGKRISTVVRGVVPTEQLERTLKASTELPVNRCRYDESQQRYAYDNGIILKKIPENIPPVEMHGCRLLEDYENVTMIEANPQENAYLISELAKQFNLPLPSIDQVKIIRLMKRDGGFSQFKLMNLEISPSSIVLMINSSILPPGYRYFNLAEDKTQQGFPWIQLYLFEPSSVMKVSGDVFNLLSMSPVEELLYRDETKEVVNSVTSSLKKKLVSRIDLVVIPPQPL